jgi:large repetitive protein
LGFGKRFNLKNKFKRIFSVVVSLSFMVTIIPLSPKVSEAATTATEPSLITDYQPSINEVIDSSGFKHPGVGLTKDILENMRSEVRTQKEPWYSYYKAMTVSSSSSKTIASSNESSTDPTKPATTAFNSQSVESTFIADGLKAYTQALMYYITGDDTYRANAMHIIRIWEQMDPSKYAYYTDAHIHAGYPLNRMVTAAEILRYSSYKTAELAWTDQDTANFTNNLINPVINTLEYDNSWFMNQNNYALLGAMAGFIFTNNREGYNQRVEWFTVNKTAKDQGYNGSIKQLFRLVDTNAATGEKLDKPVVQHVEMGRDNAHGSGDLTNAAVIARMLLAQGTKVDPVEGTVSTKDNAIDPYEFLNDRILAAANFYSQYMLGYDTPWVPVPYAISQDGTVRGIYKKFSDSYRGRSTTALFWDIYYYYTYIRGVNVAEKAPYFYEAFIKRTPSNYYYKGAFTQAWDSVDGGGDWWIYIPKAAESEGAKYLPKEQTDPALVQVEERYTAFDNNTSTVQEGDTSFVEFKATAEGSKIALQNLSYADRTNSRLIGIKFRTNGPATLELSKDLHSTPYYTLALPDTKGLWKYITYDMGINHVSYGQQDSDYSLLYINVKGAGSKVDIDQLNVQAGTQLTPPAFKAGNSDLNMVAYVGTPVNLDFSAVDPSSSDVITYEIQNGPDGPQFNGNTGAFSWQPTQAGTYSFIVTVSDSTTLTAKKVHIVVTKDRSSAVQAAIEAYNRQASYVTASLNKYNNEYSNTMSQLQTATDANFYQQLLKLKSAADGLQLVTPLLSDGSMDYTKTVVSSTFGSSLSLLADGNNNTYAAYTLAPYPNLYHILDFGPDFKVSANAFAMQGRMNFTDRMAGSAVFGSNDGANWTRLTSGDTPFTDDMATLAVDDPQRNEQYRFIKIQMLHPEPDVLSNTVNNMLELGEFRIYGERHETNNKLQTVSINSDQSLNGRIVLGNTVKLTVKAKETIKNVKVKIQGQDATVTTQDNVNWTAVATMNQGVKTGVVTFSVDYQREDGTDGDTNYFTTDNSQLFLTNESDLIQNVTSITNLMDSTASTGRTAAQTLQQVNYLFDGKPATNSDFRLNGSGAKSYITFDFKEGNQVLLSNVELLARQDQYYTRISGAVVEGSNDNKTWITLTKSAVSSLNWQMLSVSSKVPYRYIRIYNPGTWYGNIAELRLHGAVKTADLTPPVTTDDAPQGWVNKDTKVSFKATDDSSGIAAIYYTVDGGVQQTGNSVTLTTEGTHKIIYWSVDYAGNVEQSHSTTVKIDKTGAEITVSGLEKGSLSDALYILPVISIKDSMSGVDDSKTQITLDGNSYQPGDAIQLYKLPLGSHTLIVNGSDLAGNPASYKVTFNTYASIAGLKQLVTRFATNNWIDNAGITNSLQQKLGNSILQTFINDIQGQRGKHISNEAAEYLLRDANALLN